MERLRLLAPLGLGCLLLCAMASDTRTTPMLTIAAPVRKGRRPECWASLKLAPKISAMATPFEMRSAV